MVKIMSLKQWKEGLLEAINNIDDDGDSAFVKGEWPGGHQVSHSKSSKKE